MSLQECQNNTTSTEFVEWMLYLEKIEWEDNSKLIYHIAQIAAEVRRFREAFSKSPKSVSVDDCIIKFKKREETAETTKDKSGGIEVGDREALQDPKWARVNSIAKSSWGAMIGLNLSTGEPLRKKTPAEQSRDKKTKGKARDLPPSKNKLARKRNNNADDTT